MLRINDKVQIVGNVTSPGIGVKSYTHHKTGKIVDFVSNYVLVKLNSLDIEIPYRYQASELKVY